MGKKIAVRIGSKQGVLDGKLVSVEGVPLKLMVNSMYLPVFL